MDIISLLQKSQLKFGEQIVPQLVKEILILQIRDNLIDYYHHEKRNQVKGTGIIILRLVQDHSVISKKHLSQYLGRCNEEDITDFDQFYKLIKIIENRVICDKCNSHMIWGDTDKGQRSHLPNHFNAFLCTSDGCDNRLGCIVRHEMEYYYNLW